MQFSLVIPSRNNLQYFKWAYKSIRENQEDHEVYICAANDASTDGTLEYFEKLDYDDPYFKYINNPGPERLGHTILYDRIVDELVTTDVMGIYHADMYLCPGALDRVEELLKPKTVVSLTRIEPPIWPPGPEKVIQDFGTEPSEFNECDFLKWYAIHQLGNTGKITSGVFAPWFIYTSEFKQFGHDKLFAPQSKEDSDIWNRMKLSGFSFVQPRDANVYHLTCRGSRRNPTLTDPTGSDSDEWVRQNRRSHRNFFRKWGSDIQVTPEMLPLVPPKYKVYGILRGSDYMFLELLEPHFSKIFVDGEQSLIDEYIRMEQPNTLYDLKERVFHISQFQDDYGILVETTLKMQSNEYRLIKDINLFQWVSYSNQVHKVGETSFTIKDLTDYQTENI